MRLFIETIQVRKEKIRAGPEQINNELEAGKLMQRLRWGLARLVSAYVQTQTCDDC